LDGCKVAQANHRVTTGLLPKRPPDALLRPKPADCNVALASSGGALGGGNYVMGQKRSNSAVSIYDFVFGRYTNDTVEQGFGQCSISKASRAGATGANLFTRDEARRIARELAQLPELLAYAIMPASRRLNTRPAILICGEI
jgi:hypothetical protein